MKTIELYVSVDGDDSNKGTIEKPFATIQKAKQEVKQEVKKLLNNTTNYTINVNVRKGRYYFAEPLIFEPEDSGAINMPVTYKAYLDEKVTLSGGKKLEVKWEKYDDKIMVCDVTNNIDGFTQLYVNGRRQIRARYPKGDSENSSKNGYIKVEGADNWPNTELNYYPDTFTDKTWSNPENGILHIFPMSNWGNIQYRIKDIDREKSVIKLGDGGFQINTIYQKSDATNIGEGCQFFIENIFEELDEAREWYYDNVNKKLYYIPEKDIDLDNAVIEISYLKNIVKFNGTKSNPVQHIRIEGFDIANTETTYLDKYEAPSLGDWCIVRNAAIIMEGTQYCSINNCSFNQNGGNGILINNYGYQNNIENNRFSYIGESAICVVGKSHLDINKNYRCPYCNAEHWWGWSEPSNDIPSECNISNNLIHNIGVYGKQTAGVFLSLCKKIKISHNHIYDVPRAGICINDGMWGGHIIEYNDVHNTVQETGDHGPFNSWGREQYWCHKQSHGGESHPVDNVKDYAKYTSIIRNNRFRDNKGWGIDLDDGSSNYHVYNNVCIGVSIKLREGDYRTVENNIFINPANPPGFHVGYENNHDKFFRNIIVMNSEYDNPEVDIDYKKDKAEGKIYDIIAPPNKGRWFEYWDFNLFISDRNKFIAAVHDLNKGKDYDYTIDEWRKLGFDKHSVYGDPMFVNAEEDDYTVRNNSPALKLGFKNFDMNDFGIEGIHKFKEKKKKKNVALLVTKMYT